VRPRLITPPYLEYLYSNDRRDEVRRLLAAARVGGPNRDAAPVCYQYTAMLWLSKFYPDLAAMTGSGGGISPWVLGALLAATMTATIAWLRQRPRRRLGGLLFAAGFIGMVIETILLLQYQIANGIVFQQVGWLLTCFMAGLAGGGYAFGAPLPIAAGVVPRPKRGTSAVLSACAAAALVWASAAALPSMAGLAGTSLMLFATGFAVSRCFAFASAEWVGDRAGAAASLYAADVAGGAAGAVIATLILVPAVGLDGSALMAAIGSAGLMLFIPPSGSGGR
jgi:hypothetical protein